MVMAMMRLREIADCIEQGLSALAEASAYSGKSDAARERHFEALGVARQRFETALLLTREIFTGRRAA